MSFAEIKMEYRFLAFLLALLVAFSVISVPANAILVETIVGAIGVMGFADLLTYALYGEAFIPTVGHFLHDKLVGAGVLPADGERYSAEQINAAYDSYVSDMELSYKTTTISNDGIVFYFTSERGGVNGYWSMPIQAFGKRTQVGGNNSSDYGMVFYDPNYRFVAPCSGYITSFVTGSFNGCRIDPLALTPLSICSVSFFSALLSRQ